MSLFGSKIYGLRSLVHAIFSYQVKVAYLAWRLRKVSAAKFVLRNFLKHSVFCSPASGGRSPSPDQTFSSSNPWWVDLLLSLVPPESLQ